MEKVAKSYQSIDEVIFDLEKIIIYLRDVDEDNNSKSVVDIDTKLVNQLIQNHFSDSKEFYKNIIEYYNTMFMLFKSSNKPEYTLEYFIAVILEIQLKQWSKEISESYILPKNKSNLFNTSFIIFLLCHLPNKKSNFFLDQIYNNIVLYESLIKSCFICMKSLKSILLVTDNDVVQSILSLFLMCILRVHNIQQNEDIHIPRYFCLEFLFEGFISNNKFIQIECYKTLNMIVQSIVHTNNTQIIQSFQSLFVYILSRYIGVIPFDSKHDAISLSASQFNENSISTQSLSRDNIIYALYYSSYFFHFLTPESQKFIIYDYLISYMLLDDKSNFALNHVIPEIHVMKSLWNWNSFTIKPNLSFNTSRYLLELYIAVIQRLSRYKPSQSKISVILIQLKICFQAISYCIHLISEMDAFNTLNEYSIYTQYRQQLTETVYFFTCDSLSFYPSVMLFENTHIQETIVEGWNSILNISYETMSSIKKGGMMLHPMLLNVSSCLLKSTYKYLWKYAIQCIQHNILSFHNILIKLYSFELTEEIPFIFRHFNDTLNIIVTIKLYDISDFQTRQKDIFNNNKYSRLFTPLFTNIQDLFFNFIYKPAIEELTHIFTEIESLQIQDTDSQETQSMTTIQFKEIKVYRNELMDCISSCFVGFGSRNVLSIACLNLRNLITVPLSSPQFTKESQAWLIPLLSSMITNDNMIYFFHHILPIIRDIEKNMERLGESEIDKRMQQQYHLIWYQLWGLIHSYSKQALDIHIVFSSSTHENEYVDILLNALENPTLLPLICSTLQCISQQYSSNTAYNKHKNHILNTILYKNNIVKYNPYGNFGNQLITNLVMHYLNLYKHNLKDSTDKINHDGQIILNTISGLIEFCDSTLLEKNLQDFIETWNTVLTEATYYLSHSDTVGEDYVLPFSPAECGALVSIVNCLMECVSETTIQYFFDTFLKLLMNCTQGISNLPNSHEFSKCTNEYSVVTQIKKHENCSLRDSFFTLQILLRRSYKGFKNIVGRALGNPDFSSILNCIHPDNFNTVWKNFFSTRNVARLTSSIRYYMEGLHALVRLLCHLYNSWKHENHPNRDQIIQDILRDLCPDILFNMSESNETIRKLALDILQLLFQNLVTVPNLIISLLPGLASPSHYMKSSCCNALIFLLDKNEMPLPDEFILKIILMSKSLFHDKSKSVFHNSVKLVIACQKYLSEQELFNNFSHYIEVILKSEYALTFRLTIRLLIEHAIEKIGIEKVVILFPEKHKALVHYVHRNMRRAKEKDINMNDKPLDIKANILPSNSLLSIYDDQLKALPHHEIQSLCPILPKQQLLPLKKQYVAHGKSNKRTKEQDTISDSSYLDLANSENEISQKYQTCIIETDNFDLMDGNTINSSVLVECQNTVQKNKISKNKFLNNQKNSGKRGMKMKEKTQILKKNNKNKKNKIFETKALKGLTKTRFTEKFGNEINNRFFPYRCIGHFIERSKDISYNEGTKKSMNAKNVQPYSYIRLIPKMRKEKNRQQLIHAYKQNAFKNSTS